MILSAQLMVDFVPGIGGTFQDFNFFERGLAPHRRICYTTTHQAARLGLSGAEPWP